MSNPSVTSTNMLSWDDVSGVDTSSQAFKDTGSAMLTLGVNVGGENLGITANLLHPPGFFSLPIAGTVGKGTGYKVLSYVTNNEYFSLGGRDYANQQKVGNVKEGESMMYSPAGEGIMLMKADSSINILSRIGGSPTGGMLGMIFDPLDNIQCFTNGGSFLTIDGAGGSAALGNKSGCLTIDNAGDIILNGSGNIMITGTNIVLAGGHDGLCLATPNNILTTANMAAIAALSTACTTAESLGPAAGPAVATALVAFCVAMTAALTAFTATGAYTSQTFAS
jgi:hypothetical protein